MSSKLKGNAGEIQDILEFLGTFTYPDASGDRMGFTGRKKLPLKQVPDFPYDEEQPWYGQPHAYDRGSGGREASHASVILPHDVSHSAWDDVDEAMGTPYFFGKAVQGAQMGHATGIPGADGGWANSPMKPWDEDDEDETDKKLDRYGEAFGPLGLTINPSVPQPEPIPNKEPEKSHDQTDDEVEKKLDRIWHRDDNPNFSQPDPDQFGGGSVLPSGIFIVPAGSGFQTGLGGRGSRGRYGLIPKESIWVALERWLKKT